MNQKPKIDNTEPPPKLDEEDDFMADIGLGEDGEWLNEGDLLNDGTNWEPTRD